jgi:hypothetical protein
VTRIDRLDPKKALDGEDEMAKAWVELESSSPSLEVYEKSLAEQWRATGCTADGAPYVLRGLLHQLEFSNRFDEQSLELPALAAAFLDEEHCPGALGLSEVDKAKLKAIRDHAPTSEPKQ